MARKRLTPDEQDAIIEQKLDRVPVRTIAVNVGCTTRTVQETWKRWLDATAEERAEAIERIREELIQRQARIATDARKGANASRAEGDRQSEVRYLAEERAALREIARLTGSDAPAKIEHSGDTGITVVRIVEEIAVPGGD